MIQWMVAMCIKQRLGREIQISGYNMPDWNLAKVQLAPLSEKRLTLRGHHFQLSQIVQLLRMYAIDELLIEGWGFRLDQFESPPYYNNFFVSDVIPTSISDDEILIHIRAGDILSGWHPEYYPLPHDFYRNIIAETGLKPVFIGELDAGEFTNNLKINFPHARFLPKRSVIEDFQTIRKAKNIVISTSSYAWLASWLSDQAQNIYYPICGLLNPLLGSTWLMPIGDERYHFYSMPFPNQAERNIYGPINWVNLQVKIVKLTPEEAKHYLLTALYPKPSQTM